MMTLYFRDDEDEGPAVYSGKLFPVHLIILEAYEIGSNETECVSISRISAYGEPVSSVADEKDALARIFL